MEELGCPQRPHKAKIVGSNPTSATQSGVVQRQDAALLRQLSGFESLRRSRGRLAQLVVRQPVKLEGTGSNPVVAATPASPLQCGQLKLPW